MANLVHCANFFFFIVALPQYQTVDARFKEIDRKYIGQESSIEKTKKIDLEILPFKLYTMETMTRIANSLI